MKEWWEMLAAYIEKINRILSYQPGENKEMDTFLDYLRRGCCPPPTSSTSYCFLASMPLFWTPAQRKAFVGDAWDIAKKQQYNVASLGHLMEDWRTVMSRELPLFVRACRGLPAPFGGNHSPLEEDTRDGLSFMRTSLVHSKATFDNVETLWAVEEANMLPIKESAEQDARDAEFQFGSFHSGAKERQQKLAQHLKDESLYKDFNTNKLHRKFEELFPCHVEKLQKVAVTWQKILLPSQPLAKPQTSKKAPPKKLVTLLIPLREELTSNFTRVSTYDGEEYYE